MINPGVYQSPTDGWAFVPFIGALLAFAIAVVAVLYWIAGATFRNKALALTLVGLAIGAGSCLGLIAEKTSFELREDLALADYAKELRKWADAKYGVVLTERDVSNLAHLRPASVLVGDDVVELRLRSSSHDSGVYFVDSRGEPLPEQQK